jgi:type I restriction enzyme S subunit
MTGFQNTDVGQIPSDWKCLTIGAAYEICNQGRLPLSRERRQQMEGPYPYYGPTGVLDHINEYRFDGTYALIGEDGDHFLKFYRQPMTLMVCGRFNVNNHAHVVGPRGENMVEWFQAYFENRDITRSLTRQGAGRFKLRKAALEQLPLALPPSSEQRLIVEAISHATNLIASLERLIDKKQAIKQGIMQRLLTGETRLPGFASKWVDRALSELAIVDPENLSVGTNPREAIDYISLEDVNRGVLMGFSRITFWDAPSRARRVIREMDVLFGTVRPNLQSHLMYVGGLARPVASTGFSVIRAIAGRADPKFLFYLIMSNLAVVQIDRIIAGSNYPAVSSGDVRNLRFEFPDLPEQLAIGAVLADCDSELAVLRKRLTKAKVVKQGMMQELFSGRSRLTVSEAKV